VAVQWFSPGTHFKALTVDYDISRLTIVNFSNFKALPVDKDISQQEIVNFISLTMECGEISRSTESFKI
jgi:hypothetical protein